jgi:hypothetical protein
MQRRLLVLTVLNALAGIGSLCFVPLAAHIATCTASVKWCHAQALVFGAPAALVIFVLGAATLTVTWSRPQSVKTGRLAIFGVWAPLAIAASVLVLLLGAVIYNS